MAKIKQIATHVFIKALTPGKKLKSMPRSNFTLRIKPTKSKMTMVNAILMAFSFDAMP
jgi:hypothetical protein